jgi:hypothetical protein
MRTALLLVAAACMCSAQQDKATTAVLARVSEEANSFCRTAPKLLASETLKQKALKHHGRFRLRVGASAAEPPKPQYRTREIVSEYGFSNLKDAPGLHEFREVISVDGRQVSKPEEAKRSLTAGIQAQDDRAKRRMLEKFEKLGLTGAAADFGQVLLLFARRQLPNYAFAYGGESRIGADAAIILNFKQQAGSESLLIFEKRKSIRQPLEGQLWVRRSDYLPLRISLTSTRQEATTTVRDEATVDYGMSSHGSLVPVSMVHKQYVNDGLTVESLYSYSSFRKFSADAEIKFNSEAPVKK